MKQILKCILWVLLNFAIQFIVQLGMSISAVAQGMEDEAVLNAWLMDNILLTTLISNLIFIGIVCVVFAIKRSKLLPENDSIKALKSCALPCAAALMYSIGFSLLFSGNTPMIQNSVEHYSQTAPWLGIAMMVINLLILAPVAEELLCRRIMLDGLRQRFSAKTAVIVSAVIFGAMHLMAGGPALAVGAAFMGLLLGIVYVRTGSLVAAMLVHLTANLPDFILMALPPADGALKTVIAVICLTASVTFMLVWCRHDLKTFIK